MEPWWWQEFREVVAHRRLGKEAAEEISGILTKLTRRIASAEERCEKAEAQLSEAQELAEGLVRDWYELEENSRRKIDELVTRNFRADERAGRAEAQLSARDELLREVRGVLAARPVCDEFGCECEEMLDRIDSMLKGEPTP